MIKCLSTAFVVGSGGERISRDVEKYFFERKSNISFQFRIDSKSCVKPGSILFKFVKHFLILIYKKKRKKKKERKKESKRCKSFFINKFS